MTIQQLPNFLTTLRVLLIPVLIIVYQPTYEYYKELATFVFFIASISDFFDGYLARKYNVISNFGKFFDPVADKLLVAVSLMLIAVAYQNTWVTLASLIIISREIFMSAFREWVASLPDNTSIAVSSIGKWKTAFQMLALGGLFWDANVAMRIIAYGCLLLATLLAIYSLLSYFRLYSYSLKEKK